jgi:hypothetical protein
MCSAARWHPQNITKLDQDKVARFIGAESFGNILDEAMRGTKLHAETHRARPMAFAYGYRPYAFSTRPRSG